MSYGTALAEVDDFHKPIDADHDIVGLEVGMDVTLLVQGLQSSGHFLKDYEEMVEAVWAVLFQRFAGHVFHEKKDFVCLKPLLVAVQGYAMSEVLVVNGMADLVLNLDLFDELLIFCFLADNTFECESLPGGGLHNLPDGRTRTLPQSSDGSVAWNQLSQYAVSVETNSNTCSVLTLQAPALYVVRRFVLSRRWCWVGELIRVLAEYRGVRRGLHAR